MSNFIAAVLVAASGAVSLFDGAVGWINTDKPVHLDDLRGKVVVVDFWTYCCINCLHTLPTLEYLEEKFPNELVVIGVHSAKFETEKSTESIREAVLRYNIKHPVANDANFKIWRNVGVKAWPTILLIDPEGQPVGMSSGEPDPAVMEKVIGQLVDKHRANGTLDETPIKWALAAESAPETTLSYPGKLFVDSAGGRLFVSDTNHNRILVCGLDGLVQEVIGDGEMKFEDGDFETASFNHPQGLALEGDLLYVADVENHALRVVDLKEKRVSTLAGNGKQGSAATMESGVDMRLSSPWDVVIWENKALVAMAGSHQIWEVHKESGRLKLFAGSGREDIIDAWRMSAALAQPSGLSVGDGAVYFADSEVSGVRRGFFDADGRVETLIGEGLFEFGDIDGPAGEARLQHCLGVAYVPGGVYIADTYNHKIKYLDLEKMEVRTVLGTGTLGDALGDTVELHEPNDVKVAGGVLYIADTNNHRILKHDPAAGTTEEIVVRFGDAEEAETLPVQKVAAGAATLGIKIDFPEGTKVTPDAPFSVKVESLGDGVAVGTFDGAQAAVNIEVPLEVKTNDTLRIRLSVPYCAVEDARVCSILLQQIELPIEVEEGAGTGLEVSVSAPELTTGESGVLVGLE